MKVRPFLPAFLLAVMLLSCQSASFKYDKPVAANGWVKGVSVPYKGPEGEFFVQVQIFFPEGFVKGDMLRSVILLPPRGKAITEWERNSIAKK